MTRRPNISGRGAGEARGLRCGIGLAGRWCGEARGPGGAGCAIGRLSWHVQSLGGEAASRRALVRRKAAAFERGAWVVGEAGMEASGQAGEACRWRAALAWLGWAARRGCDDANRENL